MSIFLIDIRFKTGSKRFIRVPNKDKAPSFWIIVDENKGLQGKPFRNRYEKDMNHYSQFVGVNNSDMLADNDENKQHDQSIMSDAVILSSNK